MNTVHTIKHSFKQSFIENRRYFFLGNALGLLILAVFAVIGGAL